MILRFKSTKKGQKKSQGFKKVIAAVSVFLMSVTPAMAQVRTDFGLNLGERSPVEVAVQLINWFLAILALLTVILIIYAGFVWMLSAGNEEKIDKAKRILKSAIIGLAIILSAWGITLYLLRVLGEATEGTHGGGVTEPCATCWPGDASSFRVVDVYPENKASNVSLCAVQVTMSADVDASKVNADTFYLQVEGGKPAGEDCTVNADCLSDACDPTSFKCSENVVAGSRWVDLSDPVFFDFVLDNDFSWDTTYKATVEGGATGVVSADGEAMDEDFVWYFTTGSTVDETPPTVVENCVDDGAGNIESCSSPFPWDTAGDICLNTPIGYTFSEAMLMRSFKDTNHPESFVLTPNTATGPDWNNPIGFKNWSFKNSYSLVSVRPQTQLEPNKEYGVRLYAGNPTDNYAGAITDVCGNPIDGNYDSAMDGADADNYIGPTTTPTGFIEPLTWTTGENAACTPVITSITPLQDYYRKGSEAASLLINGLYLWMTGATDVIYEGSTIYASTDYNTCFDDNYLGNLSDDLSVGAACLDPAEQSLTQLQVRTPAGANDSNIQIRADGETSAAYGEKVAILSPYIKYIDPSDGAVGQYITIAGKNYGDDRGTNGKVIMRTAENTRYTELKLPDVCDDTWSDDEIVAIAPEKDSSGVPWVTGEVGHIQVINDAGNYSNLKKFTFSDVVRPNLCEIDPSCGNISGLDFTVTGERFGTSRGSDDQVAFIMDEATAYNAAITSWNDKEILGKTFDPMPQSLYYVRVVDGDADPALASNSRKYNIPCDEAPKVVDISTCDEANDIYPVPNPRPSSDNACLNATIRVLFNKEMDASSFTTGDNTKSVYLEQFNTDGGFDSTVTPTLILGDFDDSNKGNSLLNETIGVTYGADTYYGFNFDIRPGGYWIGLLTRNTWYQLTITNTVKSTEGVNMAANYYLRFKTEDTTEPCQIDAVKVNPDSIVVNAHPSTGDYGAEGYSQCRLLDPGGYSWDWKITDPGVQDVAYFSANNAKIRTGVGAAETVRTAGNDEVNEGAALVDAAAEGFDDDAQFKMDLSFCTSNEDCESCTGSICDLAINRCTPVIDNFAPIAGDYGTWVTINGCMFGSRKGNVYMNEATDAYAAEVDWPDLNRCGDTWTADQVVIEVPATYDNDNDSTTPEISLNKTPNYNFEVETVYGHKFESASVYDVNDTTNPGLCKIVPKRAAEGAATSAIGRVLGDVEGFAKYMSTPPPTPTYINGAVTSWNDLQIDSTVPTGAITDADAGYYARTADGKDSNPLAFEVSCYNNSECGTGCCDPSGSGLCVPAEQCAQCFDDADCQVDDCTGSSCVDNRCTPYVKNIDPVEGPVNGPVTINGCYFGSPPQDIPESTSGLVALWRFDEGAGSTYLDSAGSNDGYAELPDSTPLWTEGKFDNALDFDGEDDYIRVDNAVNYEEFSVEAWVKLDNPGTPSVLGNTDTIISTVTKSAVTSQINKGFYLQNINQGKFKFSFVTDEYGTQCSTGHSDLVTAPNTWYHVAAVYGQDKTVKLYINGVLSKSNSCPTYKPGDVFLTIGTHAFGVSADFYHDGMIDSVALYNRALSDEEVRDHASSMVLFGAENANILCDPGGWSNERIIAQAPENLVASSIYGVQVIDDRGKASNNDQEFTVSDMCFGGGALPSSTGMPPILCDIDPEKGRATSENGAESGTVVSFYGDKDSYVAGQTENVFYGEDESGNPTYLPADDFEFIDQNETEGRVPYGSTLDPSRLDASLARAKVEACMGNAIDFQFECTNADECPEGICVDGVCVADPCGGDCSGNVETVCGTKKGCYWDTTESDWCCAQRPILVSTTPANGAAAVCPNTSLSLEFDQKMDADSLASSSAYVKLEKIEYDANGNAINPVAKNWTNVHTVETDATTGAEYSIDQIFPTGGLDKDVDYRLTLVSDNATETGVVDEERTLTLRNGTQEIFFHTKDQNCAPGYVEVLEKESQSSNFAFTEPGGQAELTATLYSTDGQPLQPVDDLAWEWTWEPYYDENRACANVAWIDLEASGGEQASATSSTQTFTVADDVNGESVTMAATATGTAGWTDSLSGEAYAFVIYCGANIFRYRDEISGDNTQQFFDLAYCTDSGLPVLTNTALNREEGNLGVDGEWYRQYIFTNPANAAQTFGILIFENVQNLPPDIWYETHIEEENQGKLKEVKNGINGYRAFYENGKFAVTYYIGVSALTDTDIDGNSLSELINNIFVISFAKEDTLLEIADEIMQNIKFNTNYFLDDPSCEDSDRQQLIRDTNRINDLGEIAYYANQYYEANDEYPLPKSGEFGSYIENITTSMWNSWQGALGNLLEQTLPEDEYNFFYAADEDDPWNAGDTPWIYNGTGSQLDCENAPQAGDYFDEEGTCWDPVNNYFYCPNNSYTYLWKRKNSADKAELYARLEYESTTTEQYVTQSSMYDPCSTVDNADCACYNYGAELDSSANIVIGIPL